MTYYGLQRNGRWLLPPAMDVRPSGFTDDPAEAWSAPNRITAENRQVVLLQAFGITLTICKIPNG